MKIFPTSYACFSKFCRVIILVIIDPGTESDVTWRAEGPEDEDIVLSTWCGVPGDPDSSPGCLQCQVGWWPVLCLHIINSDQLRSKH